MKKENGFTLVEIIIALFIGTIMLVGIYATINSAQLSSSGVERRIIAQQDARSALELMAMEIRMASYNSQSVGNIWVNPADCVTTSGNQNYRGIQEATANSLAIEMDMNDNGVITKSNNPNEIIRYAYDSTNQYITRNVNCDLINQPFLGALNVNSDTKTVLVVNNIAGTGGTAIPVFRYYDGNGVPIAAPVTTAIPDIRRIEITLVADTSTGDPGSVTRRRIIYSTSVIPRNHTTPVY
jgi:prepilin-type N-terminal cleavage/methylation domain-containing protein